MRIALATCIALPELTDDDRLLVAALEQRGADVVPAVWNDPDVAWGEFPLVVIRSTWDYVEHWADFLAWTDAVASLTRLENPASLVRWNVHKAYLRELGEAGVPIVPTAWIAEGARTDLAALVTEHGWDEVVVKPSISAGSRRTIRTTVAEAAGHQAEVEALSAELDVMVQPFLDDIRVDGERSLVFIDGQLSHAYRKLPVAGDFRVQLQFGGSADPMEPSAEELAVATATLGALDAPPLYARVDLVTLADGSPGLIELECIEPVMSFALAPGSADRMAEAILDRA